MGLTLLRDVEHFVREIAGHYGIPSHWKYDMSQLPDWHPGDCSAARSSLQELLFIQSVAYYMASGLRNILEGRSFETTPQAGSALLLTLSLLRNRPGGPLHSRRGTHPGTPSLRPGGAPLLYT